MKAAMTTEGSVQATRAKGARSREIGRNGEALFLHLASQWGGFEYTPLAEGTDGYLRWPSVMSNRLFVQIRTTNRRRQSGNYLPVSVEASHLRDWYACRPLLVRCVLNEERAWWKDTADDEWALDTNEGKVFRVPLNQPVDATTREQVQKIALQRPRYTGPGVVPVHARKPLNPIHLVPETLRSLSHADVLLLLRDIYAEMRRAKIIERDGLALAAARIVYSNLHTLKERSLDEYLNVLLLRVLSKEQGGRSYTLGALAGLLNPRLDRAFDRSFLPAMEKAVDNSVTAGTFVNPEFGLIVGASLVLKFPDVSHLSDHIRDLACQAADEPQTMALKKVADAVVAHFCRREMPVLARRAHDGVAQHILKPLQQDDEIFAKLDEAIETAWEIVGLTPAAASSEQLDLFNQLTKFQASSVLDKLKITRCETTARSARP